VAANQQWEEPMPEAKPYDIPKQLVRDAYLRVKANRGAAGVDGVSLAAFEKDLKGNLYKVWNVRAEENNAAGARDSASGLALWRSLCSSNATR
jgi:hypothetical protein